MTGNSNYSMKIADMKQELIDADKYLQPTGEISPGQKELIKFLEERNFGKVQKIRSYFNAETNEKILVIVL